MPRRHENEHQETHQELVCPLSLQHRRVHRDEQPPRPCHQGVGHCDPGAFRRDLHRGHGRRGAVLLRGHRPRPGLCHLLDGGQVEQNLTRPTDPRDSNVPGVHAFKKYIFVVAHMNNTTFVAALLNVRHIL